MSNNSEPPGATASGPAITDDNDARNDKLRLRCRMLEMEGLQDDNSLGPQAGLLFNRLICTGMSAPMLRIHQSKTLQSLSPSAMRPN